VPKDAACPGSFLVGEGATRLSEGICEHCAPTGDIVKGLPHGVLHEGGHVVGFAFGHEASDCFNRHSGKSHGYLLRTCHTKYHTIDGRLETAGRIDG
jgi:hypothetical protein